MLSDQNEGVTEVRAVRAAARGEQRGRTETQAVLRIVRSPGRTNEAVKSFLPVIMRGWRSDGSEANVGWALL